VVLLACVLYATPGTVAAQEWDPTAAVSAYSAALNAHDMPAALALFDQYGSATDAAGHHFEGSAGLAEFLLGNGFNNPDARITTEGLHIVANRAVWTYSCSCATRSTEVRLVMNHNKISVFAVVAPPAPPQPRSGAGLLLWLVGLGLTAGTLAGGFSLWRRRTAAVTVRQDQAQGRLLAALLQSRQGRQATHAALRKDDYADKIALPVPARARSRSAG
jgi:hypothetical protein